MNHSPLPLIIDTIRLGVAYPFCLLYNPRQKMSEYVKGRQGTQSIYRLFVWQVAVTLLVSLACLLGYSSHAALSVLMGALVCILPSAYFAKRLFRYRGASAAKKIVASAYKGEAIKLVLTALLFTAAFVYVKVIPSLFFIAFVLAQLSLWLAPLFVHHKTGNLK